MNVRTIAAWVLCAAAPALVACGGASSTSDSDNLVVSIGIGEPKFLVPSTATESYAHQVMEALFTPLVDYDDEFRPRELAAESITTADNTVWTIKLRPGWTFHNGEPVTADSYINAWNAGAWGPNAHDGNYFFDKIQGYADLNPRDAKTAPRAKKLTGLVRKDDLTFDVTLSEPYVNFKSMLGYTAFHPLPGRAFLDVANNVIDPQYQESPIGQGPFKMKGAWQHDQLIETERYENYAGDRKPHVAGVSFKIYQQITTQYQDLLAGQLDVVPRLPIENIGSARSDLGDRYRQSPASVIHFLSFPTFDRHFSKPEIRRAISMAIDRDEITTTLFLDSQKPLRSFVSPVVPGYRENTCGEWCTFNPVRAKALFESAGGAKAVGGRIEIAYNVDGGHKPWIDATCNQLRANLGVDCVGNPQPKFAELLTKVKAKQPVGLFRMGWIFDYPAMENYLGPLYTTYGSSNYYGYSNPEFDRIVAAGDAAATPDAATELYKQAEAILVRDMPVVPLRYEQNNFGHSTRVKNVQMNTFFVVELLELEANRP
jgi:peptide/nickel transport system substrate-binding protein/oligopeptide transport system substrate-binding protein